MTALTAARVTKSRNLGQKFKKLMAASTTIYAGGMVMLNSAGYAQPAGNGLASPTGVVGVATATVTNSGSAGAAEIECQEGEFLFVGTTLTQAVEGLYCYAEDDQTVDDASGSNEPIAGVLVQYVSSTSGWVRIGQALGPTIDQVN